MKLDTRTIVIGIIIIVAVFLIGPRLFNTDNVATIPDSQVDNQDSQTVDDNIQLGQIVSAQNIDRDGCPVNTTTSFETSESVYVVAENSDVPSGTSVFVRLYHEGTPVEDAPEITADQDYTDSCINFVFEPSNGASFDPGAYEAEFIVNGNPAESVTFEIR
jgi:hypothetical protein